ncbi:MAG: ATP-grasp domain-containing protein, partial [Bacteroidetes bacterium]|nr:ATP-grasp domain-containing protein [Bacteroidota bacterium]
MKKVGILGGGQLGRMLLQAAANYPVITYVLENDADCPSAHLCHQFINGDITSYEDVYSFGKNLDALTIEIESVNLEALYQLEKEGKKIYPAPAALEIIKNKRKQKEFYAAQQIPTAPFIIVSSKNELKKNTAFFPAAQKLALGGYDGKGVMLLRNESDIANAFDEESVLEKEIDIKKEIAIIIGVNEQGATAMYSPVEMIFNSSLNMLDYQISPAR